MTDQTTTTNADALDKETPMTVYDQIQNLAPGTEATITLRGTVRDWGGLHFLEVGGSNRLLASLKHAESITVHEPVIKWQIGDVVQGASGITFVRGQDGRWRAPSGNPVAVTDKVAPTYTPVIREGKIVAPPAPDDSKGSGR